SRHLRACLWHVELYPLSSSSIGSLRSTVSMLISKVGGEPVFVIRSQQVQATALVEIEYLKAGDGRIRLDGNAHLRMKCPISASQQQGHFSRRSTGKEIEATVAVDIPSDHGKGIPNNLL